MDAFPFALMGKRGKFTFANELSHSSSRSHITGRQRSQARGVEITQLAMNGYLLSVFIDQHHQARRGVQPQTGKDRLDLVVIRLANDDRSAGHLVTTDLGSGEREGRMANPLFRDEPANIEL